MGHENDLPVGSTVTRIRRALFVFGADLDGDSGDLELTFENGKIFTFSVAGDGDSLSITCTPWSGEFSEPLSPENREFVTTSGKWEIFDMGVVAWTYRQFIGRVLTGLQLTDHNEVRLDFNDSSIVAMVVADELHVSFNL